MILLDTDVLSGLMRARPAPSLVRWLDRQPAESIWITSITVFEVRMGLNLLPAGRRRTLLESAFESLSGEILGNRIAEFDGSAALAAAGLCAHRRKRGTPVDMRDTQIAGIALSRRATLATGNERHYGDLDVPVVNPFV